MSGDNNSMLARTPVQDAPYPAAAGHWARFAAVVVLDSPADLEALQGALTGHLGATAGVAGRVDHASLVPLLAGQPDRQTVIVEATALLNELALVFRSYEKHHRAKVPEDAKPGTAEWVQHSDAMAKSERNGQLAERVETMLHKMLVPYQVPVIQTGSEAIEALVELVECARLRGDNDLPSPPDDPKLWTARMIDAWGRAEEIADKVTGGSHG